MSLATDLARDAAVFTDTAAFGVAVVNGSTTTSGILSVRDMIEEVDGFSVQRRRRVIKIKTGSGGTIESGTLLTIAGTVYRVDYPVAGSVDELFTDYVLAGGAA